MLTLDLDDGALVRREAVICEYIDSADIKLTGLGGLSGSRPETGLELSFARYPAGELEGNIDCVLQRKARGGGRGALLGLPIKSCRSVSFIIGGEMTRAPRASSAA